MLLRKFFFIFLLFPLFGGYVDAQPGATPQLALQYYQNGEFDKALYLFEDLFHQSKDPGLYYDYYLNCLLKTNNLKTAEQELKKISRKYPSNPKYAIDLGYVFKLTNNEKKKTSLYEAIIKELWVDEDYINKAANAFTERKEFDYAIACYLKGRKLFNNDNLFGYSLAEIYRTQGDLEKMMYEFMKIISAEPGKLQSVEDLLQDIVQDDKNYNVIRDVLMKEVLTSNYQLPYVNMLTWLYVQKKDFNEAFVQQKALDKRYGSNDVNIYQLGDICISNKAYDVAFDIYQYLINKGNSGPYYAQAKFGILDIEYLKVTTKQNPTQKEFEDLEKSYAAYLANDFYKFITVSEKLILRLAEIKAIYLGKVPEAIQLLEKYLAFSQINKDVKARMKISLGDYYIMTGDVWEATLLYSQVDKDYRDNPIGHEAKFRNAKLSFFRGEFEWASAQLEVLQGSTSELIANDALQLALVIQDVLGTDSTDYTLQMFARADFYSFRNQTDTALKILDSIIIKYPGHTLLDDVYFEKAKIEAKKRNYQEAVKLFEKVYTDYAQDILADDALLLAADIYLEYLSQPAKASELYEKIILNYSDSVFVVEARKKFRELRGDNNN